MQDGTQLNINVKSNTGDTKNQLSQVIDLLNELRKSASKATSGANETTKAANKAVQAAKAYANSFKQRAKVTAEAEQKQNQWVENYSKMQAASQAAQQKMLKDMYGEAFKQYDRTQSQMAEQTQSPMQRFKDSLRDNGLQDFKNALKSMDYPFKNFTKSLLRIAKLRLLRGIIRSITSGFREGISNIYQYSAAMNSLDASNVKGNLDSVASSLLYMKNAIASAAAPLISMLVPYLQTVVGWFITAADAAAQFFAVLGGQTTYTRAKQQATEWKNIEGAAGGAAAAAKEYENTILGFDELNVLNDPSSGGGGGGGGGASVPDYSDMFEEVEIGQSKIREFAEWLRNNWDDIKDIVLAIGTALAAWKIASGVLKFFDRLGLGGSTAKGITQIATGLVLTITGVTLSFKGGYEIGYDGVNLMDVIKAAIGVALAGAGGALVAHGLTTLGVASVGTGVGAAIGIGIALVATIVGFELGFRARLIDNAKASLEEYVGQVDEILNRQNGYVQVAEQAWQNYDSTLVDLGYAKKITDDLAVLAEKESLTNDEIDRAKWLIGELNGLGFDGINAQWNDNTERIEINTEKIYDNIEALRERARTAAIEDILTQAYKDQIQAQIDLEKANRDVEKAQSDMRARAEELGVSFDDLMQSTQFAQWATEDETSALAIANKELENATSNYKDASAVIGLYEDVLYGEKEATDATLKSVSGATDTQIAYTKEIEESSSKITTFRDNAEKTKKVVDDVTGRTNVGKDAWGKYADSVYNAQKAKFDGSNVTKGFSDTSWWADNAKEKITGVKKAVEDLSKISYSGVNIGVNTSVERKTMAHGGFVNGYANGGIIPSYASGGQHINSADLFLANENANPELVGRIGSRTAVANQGQMVEALATGIERAFSGMNSGSSNVEVVVNMDGVAVARAADRGNKSLNRRFNVQLA